MVKVDWHESGVCWKYSGSVNGEEVVKASTSIYSDKRFDDLKYKLCDFLDAESINITPREISTIACQHAAAALTNPDIKIAVVGKKADLPGLTLLVEHFKTYGTNDSWPITLFDDLAEAHKWLAT